MCTLSLLRLRQGYSLMMNRDESPSRPPATEMAGLAGGDGVVTALYPVDPPSQGSFIGVNAAGVSFALLNQHPEAYAAPEGLQSRGRLLPLALAASTAGGGLERVAAEDLSRTAPFMLVGVDEAGAPLSLRWDGRELQRRMHADGAWQTASTRLLGSEILPQRARAFDRALVGLAERDDAGILEAQQAYHLDAEQRVWLGLAELQSVSLSHCLVLPQKVFLRHWLRADLETGLEARQASLVRVC